MKLALKTMLALLLLIAWNQAPATAQTPEPNLVIEIMPVEGQVSITSLGSIPVFEVGDTFKVSIMALGVEDPGIFGSQFELSYNPNHLAAIEGSLLPGVDLEPTIVAVSEITAETGRVAYAASRQGAVDNLAGNITLATLRFEAVSPTEPETTRIHLENVKLGAKGGLEVPVGGLVDLELIIKQPVVLDSRIEGQILAQARPDQAGHEVVAAGLSAPPLMAQTDSEGHFVIENAPADTYMVTANRSGFLQAICEGVVHQAETVTTLQPVTLLAGDIDNNGEIDITDAVMIGLALNSPTGPAELNGDGIVDILDLILMAVNYGQTTTANPWQCQLPVEL